MSKKSPLPPFAIGVLALMAPAVLWASHSKAQTVSQSVGCITGIDCSAKTLTTTGNIVSGGFVASGSTVGVPSGGSYSIGPDVFLYRDAANSLGLRNGTNNQFFRLYSSYNDANNWEGLTVYLDTGGGRERIWQDRLGSGGTHAIDLGGGAPNIFFSTSYTTQWQMDGSGNLVGSATGGYVQSKPSTVSGLQACTLGKDGARSFVTDATATTFGSAVAGSGANHVPVYCDGSGTPTWKVG